MHIGWCPTTSNDRFISILYKDCKIISFPNELSTCMHVHACMLKILWCFVCSLQNGHINLSFLIIIFPPVVGKSSWSSGDYMVPAELTATFPVGSASGSSACVNLTIVDDGILEGSETLSVSLSDPPNTIMGPALLVQ